MDTQTEPKIEISGLKRTRSFMESVSTLIESGPKVFAPPIAQEGVTIIPMAKGSWGFGGGDSPNEHGKPGGTGGGGGMYITPVGFIEIKNGKAHFQPIVEPVPLLRTVILLTILLLVASSLRRKQSGPNTSSVIVQAKSKRPLFGRK